MAGDFIRWQKGLSRKPEVLQVARRLGISPAAAAGHMMVLWEWADDVTVDGNVPGATADLMDSIAGMPNLCDALQRTMPHPWLLLDSSGATFVRYERHNGQCAKRRMADAERKRMGRLSAGRPQDIRRTSGGNPQDIHSHAREEKRREEGGVPS